MVREPASREAMEGTAAAVSGLEPDGSLGQGEYCLLSVLEPVVRPGQESTGAIQVLSSRVTLSTQNQTVSWRDCRLESLTDEEDCDFGIVPRSERGHTLPGEIWGDLLMEG